MADPRAGPPPGIVADGARRLEREFDAAALRVRRLERRYRHLVRRAGALTELGGRLADRFERELERIEREAPPELRERVRELLYRGVRPQRPRFGPDRAR